MDKMNRSECINGHFSDCAQQSSNQHNMHWPLPLHGGPSLQSLSSVASSSIRKEPISIPRSVSRELLIQGLEVDEYGTVRWREGGRHHPRRWPMLRKLYDSAVIILLEFFMTMVSNMGSSVAQLAMHDLEMKRTSALLSFTTVYLMGQAIGGLIFPPIAESFGGRSIYVTSTFGYGVMCLFIAVWPTTPVVVIGRFVTGLLSAMPAVVATGSIENMWDTRARIWLIHIWIAGAVLGLALGPPIATYISLTSYGWCVLILLFHNRSLTDKTRSFLFYLAAGITAGFAFLCLGMQESRPSQLLREKVKEVSRNNSFEGLTMDDDCAIPAVKEFVKNSLALPLRLFFTEPIVFLTSIMAATVYGIIYLFSEALSVVYINGYGFTTGEASSVSLALAIGIPFTFLPRIYDINVPKMNGRNDEELEPEDKLFGFYVAAPVLAIGLWWFALTVPPLVQNVSSWVSICSLFLVGFSVVEFDNVLSGYLTDTYTSHAGSANAPMAFLRATLSGIFPLFGSILFRGAGANYTLFVLAGIATLYCGVAILFGKYGRQIRMRSSFATRSQPAIVVVEKLATAPAYLPAWPEKCFSRPSYI